MGDPFESKEFQNLDKQREFLRAAYRDPAEAQRLVRADPNYVKYRDGNGETAFHYLIIESDLERAGRLLEWGSDINSQDYYGTTPLISAATISELETVKWLLARGADPDLKTINGETALSWATSNENAKVFQYLVKLPRRRRIDFYYCNVSADAILSDPDLVMREYLISLGLSERYGEPMGD